MGAMKFIGHLDVMRSFQKIFRQGNIPIAYSGGFSPHQIFSIAAPLSVGATSEGEYLDLTLEEPIDLNYLINQLNGSCPKGLIITEAIALDDEEPAAMASVSASKYVVHQKEILFTTEQVNDFSKQGMIIVNKKNKKGNWNEMDIKPGILNLVVQEDKIFLTLATGSVYNVKPDAVFTAYSNFIGIAYEPLNYTIHREELYHSDAALIPLSVPIKPIF